MSAIGLTPPNQQLGELKRHPELVVDALPNPPKTPPYNPPPEYQNRHKGDSQLFFEELQSLALACTKNRKPLSIKDLRLPRESR